MESLFFSGPRGSREGWNSHLGRSIQVKHRGCRLLYLAGILSCLGVELAAGQTPFLFSTNNGTLTITGYTGPGGDLTIPDAVDGMPITGIQDEIMWGAIITSVTIPKGLTNIGAWAFEGEGLGNLTIAGDGTSIGDNAFGGCGGLTNVTISGQGVTIGDWAFDGCNALAQVTISHGVTSIGQEAFGHCYGLTNVVIPSTVTNIGSQAFFYCSAMPAITVDSQNPCYLSLDGVLFDRGVKTLIEYPCGRRGGYTIPDGVTSIGDGAFAWCQRMSWVVGPASLTNIGYQAFACSRLNWITLRGPLVTIGVWAFGSCSITEIALPASLTSIGRAAFEECGLTSLIVPNSVTNIGEGAFSMCGGLGRITLPSGLSTINGWLFEECGSLTSITIPNNVTSIGQAAFYGCGGLTNLFLPGGVTNVGTEAFSDCGRLVAITVAATNPSYCSLDGVLFDKNLTTLIQFPGGKTGSYTIPPSVTEIGTNAFFGNFHLTNVTVSAGVTNLADEAFAYCRYLSGIYFRGDVPKMGADVFHGSSLAAIYYLPSFPAWGGILTDVPILVWRPVMQAGRANFGVGTNQFGFTISWAAGQTLVVEGDADLAAGVWIPLQTNTLASDQVFSAIRSGVITPTGSIACAGHRHHASSSPGSGVCSRLCGAGGGSGHKLARAADADRAARELGMTLCTISSRIWSASLGEWHTASLISSTIAASSFSPASICSSSQNNFAASRRAWPIIARDSDVGRQVSAEAR